MHQLWVEKYRPKSVDEYVFRDEAQRTQVESWIRDGTVPHAIFSGSPGTGKTSLAKMLINEIGVDEYDILEINASRENSVDVMRDKITGFVQTMPYGKFKVVLLDEADFLSIAAQSVLRGMLEQYAASARFLFTANYANKIIPALHSRCQGFHIERLDHVEFTARAATILVNEDIEFDIDVLDGYVRATYPDLRKCLNSLQLNSSNGTLIVPAELATSTSDHLFTAVELFKQGKYREARQLICSHTRTDEFDNLFRWCYDNLDLFGKTPEEQDKAILVIRTGLVNHAVVADPEINFSAMLIELAGI